IRSVSSGTISRAASVRPRLSAQDAMAAPDVSSRRPAAPRSEMVRMAIRTTMAELFLSGTSASVKWHFHHLRRHSFTTAGDFECRTRGGGMRREIRRSDRLLERWTESATSHDIDLAIRKEHLVAVAGDDAFFLTDVPHQSPANPFLLHVLQSGSPGER